MYGRLYETASWGVREDTVSGTRYTVVAERLGKRFGETEALAGFDIAIPEGTVCGLLGPNGAGKTTAVRILSTLLRPDSGRAEVAGFDVAHEPDEVRRRIGLVGQRAAVDEVLSGRQNLEMFARLHHLDARTARRRAGELLERYGLAGAGDRPVRGYSGGMRRRLDLAASLILAPPVLFLDEPTTGLDPRARIEVWEAIRSLVRGGTTVLLTTQLLDEADQLAGQIALIEAGRVVADGTPDELKSRLGGDRVDVVLRDVGQVPAAAAAMGRVAGAEAEVDRELRRLSVPVRERVAALTEIVRALDGLGIAVQDMALRRPTLDEVFLHLTGHRDQPTQVPPMEREAMV
jgi:ABC-2 type transport system ATP-binding protein